MTDLINNFGSNIYLLIFFVSILINVALLVIILDRKSSAFALYWFSLLLLLGTMSAVAAFALSLSSSPASFEFWNTINQICISWIPPTILFFGIAFVNKEKLLRNLFFMSGSCTPAVVFLYLFLKTDLLQNQNFSDATWTPWGIQAGNGPLAVLIGLYFIFYLTIVYGFLIDFYKHTVDKTKKKQILLITLALLIPTISGLIFQGVLPRFVDFAIFPTAIVSTALMSVVIGYALVKYGIEIFDPYEELKKKTTELAEKVEEIEKQKVDLEKAKNSMQNLLNEEKSLDSELREEKENVEAKVKQRTKELQVEQARLRASINSLNVGFLMTDVNEGVLLINDTAKRLICLTADSHGNRALHPVDLNKLECTLNDLQERFESAFDIKSEIKKCLQEQKPIEIRDVSIDSQFFHLYLSPVVDLLDEKIDVLGVVVLIEDVTEAKALERSKDEFFSIASHELRTPLTAIRGNSAMIKEFYFKQIKDKEMKGMVNDIHDSATRLIDIVSDFLDTSRLEQGRIQFKKFHFNIVDLAKEVARELAPNVNKKTKILIRPFSKTAQVFADRERCKQVFFNLIGNAIKYTEKGQITVSFSAENQKLKVSVTDTGKGIPKENQGLLFRKFQQASNSILTRDNTRSTGLGLYISKLMVEGMRGEMFLEKSELGKGSTFSFTLPLDSARSIESLSTKARILEKG